MVEKGTLVKLHNFLQPFTEPPVPEMISYQYFRIFFPDEIITDVVEQTFIQLPKETKNIKTTEEDIRSLIGVMMKIAIVSLPSNKCSQQLQYSPVADVMSHNQFQLLLKNLHFVNNDEIDKNDKLAKIRPIVDIVCNQCIEVELED